MKTFTTCAEKKAKQFLNLLQGYTKGIRITAILILLLMGVNNAWAASEGSSWYDWASSENVYFDNTNSSYSNVSMLIGRQWNYGSDAVGSSGVNFTKISNTNNLYHAATTWNHYNTLLFIDATGWGWEGKKVTERYSYAPNYTNTNNVNINGTELFYAASNAKGATLNHQDLGSYSDLNYTQTVQQHLSTDGGSNYAASTTALATVKVSSYQLNSKNTTTSSSGTIASGSSSTTCSAARTATVTYTVTDVKSGYTFVGWYDGTTQKSTATTYNALKATGTKTITARFKENTYSVTISAGAGGTVSPSGSKTIGQVTKTTVTATPNANYEFVNWTSTGGVVVANTTSASTTITATATGTLTANFRSTATNSLTVAAGAGIASVTGSTDPVTLGSTYAITATPKTGYSFSTWTATPAANATFGSATTANTTVTVNNGSVTVTATGNEQLYALTTANSYSTGNPDYASPTTTRNDIGVVTTATVTATIPSEGYVLANWTLTNCERTDDGAENATAITVRANGNGAAKVVANYTAKTLVRLYYSNTNNWSKINAYLWKDGSGSDNNGWPGTEITNNVEVIDCEKYYYYEYYKEDHPDWNRIIFNNGSNQTSDITFSNSTNNGQFYINNAWVASPEPKWTLAGTMNEWNTDLNPLICSDATSGYVELQLTANTDYEFKFVDKHNNNWYGVSSTVTQITYTNQATARTMNGNNNANNQTIRTAGAGVYRFTWDITNKKVTVTYPTSYTVTYSQTPTAAADAPTTTPSVASGKYVAAGTNVTFTAKEAKTGYTFKGWYSNNAGTGTALSANLTYTCTINANTNIYAVYTENTYNVAIVANPAEAASTITSSPQSVGVEAVEISTTANFTYKFENWTATTGIAIADDTKQTTTITATQAGTVTANFVQMQPTTVYLKPGDNWKQANARFAIHYWHEGQPTGWVDMTEIGCNRDYFVGTIPAGYTEFMFVRMNPANPENKWNEGIDWNKTGDLTIPTDGKNLFTLPTSGDNIWNGATTTWSTYTEPTHDITINAPESGTITVTIDGNTTTVTNEATTIKDVALNAQMTVAFTPATGYKLGKAIIQIGNNEKASAAGTYTVCGPTEITAYFVTEEDQVVYLRPTDAWLANNARFVAYAFNRYAGTEAAKWIELTTKDIDYTGAFSGTIPAGFSHVQFVRMPETGDFSFAIDLAQTLNYSIPTDGINNRFILGSQITSGSDKDNYQGSWEANDTPIYGIPGDWQGNADWAAGDYPLMGPDGEVTVNITQTNDTLGFKVYHYPYGSDNDSDQWLGNNGTMVRGGAAVHEGGWTMETNKNNCGLGVDIAGDYVFAFNIRDKKLTVTYPEIPAPTTSIMSEQRVFEDEVLAYSWVAGDGTEANPYQLYADEAARITLSPIPAVEGLTAYYQFGNNEEQTSNVFDWKYISSQATTMEVKAYYKNAMGAKSAEATVNTSYFKTLALPFYLMTQPKDEINIDRIAAGANITVQFRSDSEATVDLYLNDTEGTPLTTITNEDSYDYEYDVPDDIEPCILTFIAKAQGAGHHGRIFEVKANVAIYKNVIIKVNDPEGWVKNAYMWRDGSGDVLTPWPGDPVLQHFGTWRVFSVKYPYYDRFIVNAGTEGAQQTVNWILPSDDRCYELLDPLDPENNGSDLPEDVGKYGLKEAKCPGNLIVGDLQDTTIYINDQIVVIPSIALGLGYSTSDLTPTVTSSNPSAATATMSGMNITIIGKAKGESTITVTYTLETGETATKTFKVTVEKKTHITIQVKVPSESGPESNRIGWSDSTKIYIRYWNDQEQGADIQMTYLTTLNDYLYLEAEVPLDEDGETNFHAFYEYIDSDKARWRQTDNIEKATEDGCYIVTTTGTQNSYNRGITYEGVRCLADEYQIRVLMLNGKTYTSNIVGTPSDTLSFFAPGKNETGYKAGVIMLYQNDKMIATIEPSTFAVSNVYTATLNDALNGLDNVSTYSGNYYIRTYGTSHANIGFNNGKGWNSIKDLTAVEKDSVRFTEFASREGEFYNHYWVQAMNTGSYDGKDVSACVANDYNDDLAGILLEDKHTDENGDIKVGTKKVINVRFGYDPRTNYFGRAILQGSESDTYLNLHCDNAYRDKDCTKPFPHGDGQSCLDNKMHDMSNWVYQRDFYVPITNSKPSASLYIEAKSPNKTKTVIDHLLGYVTNEITGEATTTPIQKTIIGSGTTNGTYLMRVIYDFKTNRLIAAWLPQGTVEVNTEKTLNADVLFVREENNEVPQIQLSGTGKIKSLESMFFAMELQRGDADKNNRHEEQYWFTLPFDCVVGSISGVPGYMNIWGIQRYRGDLRAQKGWFIDTPTFWEWLTPQDTLKAGEGYLLAFDKKNAPFKEIEVDKMDAEGNIIDEEKETISIMRLYFPSIKSGFDMQQQSAEQLTVTYPDHTCTITYKDRYKQDSNWKVIGTTSYSNAGVTEVIKDTDPNYDTWNNKDVPNFRYKYSYTFDNNNNRTSYSYEPENGKTATYKSFFSYMVQFAGTITWQPIMSETVPEGIAARRYVPESERTSFTTRLEIANAEGKKQDQTFVALDEKATTTFDQNLDLNKVMNSSKANIYTLSEDIPFAGNTLPMEKATVPVGVRVATAGEYTFRMPDGTDGISVFLIDNQTGVQTNMLLDEYTVTLDAGTFENRFYLAVNPDRTATSVENVGEEAKGVEKFLIDGQLFIRTADGTFDAKGQRL